MKLSHSAVNKYFECPRKYKYHYVEGWRTDKIFSPFFFGSAIDEAINVMLLTKKKKLNKEEKKLKSRKPLEIFDQYMDKEELAKNGNVEYFKSDLDISVLNKKDFDELKKSEKEIKEFVNKYHKKKAPTKKDKKIYNEICWHSLYQKGIMMLEAYEKRVIPLIEEVYSIQDKVSLECGKDEYRGFIDFTASFVDEPGIVYVIDNKTSSRPYSENSVLESDQLASYCEWANIDRAAYIVIEKKIRKREPKVRISIVKGDVTNDQKNRTFDRITLAYENICEKRFDKNENSCYNYGRPCEFYQLCHHGSKKGLTKKNDRR